MRKRHASQYANFGSLRPHPSLLSNEPSPLDSVSLLSDSVSEKLDFTSISKEMSTLFTPRELTGMMVSRGRLNEVVKFLISVVGLPSLSVVGGKLPILGYPLLDGRQSAPV